MDPTPHICTPQWTTHTHRYAHQLLYCLLTYKLQPNTHSCGAHMPGWEPCNASISVHFTSYTFSYFWLETENIPPPHTHTHHVHTYPTHILSFEWKFFCLMLLLFSSLLFSNETYNKIAFRHRVSVKRFRLCFFRRLLKKWEKSNRSRKIFVHVIVIILVSPFNSITHCQAWLLIATITLGSSEALGL